MKTIDMFLFCYCICMCVCGGRDGEHGVGPCSGLNHLLVKFYVLVFI